MTNSDNSEHYLVDLWHTPLLLEAQTEEKKAAEEPPILFKLTGWRGAGWRMIFLDEPDKEE